MPDNTLTGRCLVAFYEAQSSRMPSAGTRAVIEHIAAELTLLGHHDAARCLLSQLTAEVIPLRPRPEEPA
jgi:rubrerythrin